jgi:hypothetical protein
MNCHCRFIDSSRLTEWGTIGVGAEPYSPRDTVIYKAVSVPNYASLSRPCRLTVATTTGGRRETEVRESASPLFTFSSREWRL